MLSLLAAASAVPQPLHWADLGLKRGLDLGFFTLRYYSLAYLAGILLAYWHTLKMIRQPGAPMAQRHADDLFFWCTMGVILGGRLGYAAFYTGGASGVPSLFTHFTPGERVSWDLLRLWDGGMSFHGGLIGVLVAIAWVSWRGGLSFVRVCDYIGVCTPFGLFFGRLANFINGELWGRVAGSGVRWAMVFPGAGDLPRHPSQLYEAGLEGLAMGVLLLVLFWKTRARWRPGLLAGSGLMWYGCSRFFIEYFREPDAQLQDFAARTGLSMGQWLTVPMILIGLALVLRALARPELGKAAPAAA
ncbi:MAG: prolipoprotein diacylglyceryl transferase [Sphingomonadales bacterium]|nr:prolipoprotein diacylglyceryl transferase [Sphingomonadales bacterium]